MDGDREKSRWQHKLRRAWPHILTLLIFYHMAAVLTFCLPGTGRVLKKEAWKRPASQAGFKAWSGRVNAIGFDTTPESFEAWLWDVSKTYAGLHRKALRPFGRYANRLNLYQGWALFANPQLSPVELHVEIHTPGAGYTKIYVQRSDEFTWKRSVFDSNRMRKLIGRIARRKNLGRYPALVNWIARTAARDFPDADMVRVHLNRFRTAAPGDDMLRTNERLTDKRVLKLEPLR